MGFSDICFRGCQKMKRNKKGRFSTVDYRAREQNRTTSDHNYSTNHENSVVVEEFVTERENIPSWKVGRRIVEWEVILKNLRFCQACGLGPVPLTYESVKGELQKGLGGYLYVECSYHDCRHINIAAYGKTHRDPTKSGHGMPSFVVNTKLGTGMHNFLNCLFCFI